MLRRALAGLVLFSAFSIALVLVTPDPSDDVIAVVQASILRKAYQHAKTLQKLSVPPVQALTSQNVIFQLLLTKSLPPSLNPSKLVDLRC